MQLPALRRKLADVRSSLVAEDVALQSIAVDALKADEQLKMQAVLETRYQLGITVRTLAHAIDAMDSY